MFISAPGRPRTTSSLKSPRGVKVVTAGHVRKLDLTSRPHSHQVENDKRQAPWSANAADGQYAHNQQQQQQQQQQQRATVMTPSEDHGVAILKTEVVHFGRKIKFSIRQFAAPASFFSMKMRVSATGQKWSVFVPISEQVEKLLRFWKLIRLDERNKLSLASWMIQFTSTIFGPEEQITETSFDHEAFRKLCEAEMAHVLLLMTVRLQRGARAFLRRLRARRRSGHRHQTISSEQKRARSASSAKGQRPRVEQAAGPEDSFPPKSAPQIGTSPVLAMPNFSSVTKYAQQHRVAHSRPAGAPKPPALVVPAQSSGGLGEVGSGLEGVKFDVSGSFFDGYVAADSNSVFLLKGSEEFPSLPSSAGGGSRPPLSSNSAQQLKQQPQKKNQKRNKQQTSQQKKQQQRQQPSSHPMEDVRMRAARDLQKTADDFGFTPSAHDVSPCLDDDDDDADIDHRFDLENRTSNVKNKNDRHEYDIASLFDPRITANDFSGAHVAPAPRNKSAGTGTASKLKPPGSAVSPRSRGGSRTAPSREDFFKLKDTPASPRPHQVAQSTRECSARSSARPTPREQAGLSEEEARRAGRLDSRGLHVPMAKRVQTIKQEREVRRLEEEMEGMRREMAGLRRKVRWRDKKILQITPIYLQPKNEMYLEAARVLQPVVRAHQRKKFFRQKWAELHAELRESADGGFVQEALRIAVQSGNAAMAIDAIRRSVEVVSVLGDTKQPHSWHGIQFIPTNHEDVFLVCQVVQAFVSLQEVASFGLQLLTLISSLRNFPDSCEVLGAAGACDVAVLVLARYCEDKVMCANALKFCKFLTKTSLLNRQRCVSVSHCRALCTLLLRQMHVLPVLEKTLLLIRALCIDVDSAISTFRGVGLFDNLTYCMRTHKTSRLFPEFCKTITTICCKDGGANSQIRRDFGTRANCLIYIDGLVANQHDYEAFKHVAVMMVCICEHNSEGFEHLATDHLLTCLGAATRSADTPPRTRKNAFDLIYNLMRNCPDDKSTRKIFNKLDMLLSEEEDGAGEDEEASAAFSDRSVHDSFVEIGLGTMMEDSLLRAADQDAGGAAQSRVRCGGGGVEEGEDRSVLTFRHQLQNLAHTETDGRFLDNSFGGEHEEEAEEEGGEGLQGGAGEVSQFSAARDHPRDVEGGVDELILSIVRNIRESILTLFSDVCVQNDISQDENRSFIADVERILGSLSYLEHFREVFAQAGADGARKVELCAAFSLAFVLGSAVAPPAVLEADVVLLDYFLDKQPHSLLLYLPDIERHISQRLWGSGGARLSARLKFKLASLPLRLRLQQRALQDRRLQHSPSEDEFVGLVDDCSTLTQLARFLTSAQEECHNALALSSLARALSLLRADQEVQDDPPARDDLARALVRDSSLILSTMVFFVEQQDVQSCGLDVLACLLASQDGAAASLGRQDVLGVLNTVVWGHFSSVEVCDKFLDCVLLLTAKREAANRKCAATEESFDIVHSIMSNHMTNKTVVLKSCRYVTQLCVESDRVRLLMLKSGVNDSVLAYLEQQGDACDDDSAEVLCSLAILLCSDRLEGHIRFFASPGHVSLYLAAMRSKRERDGSRKSHVAGHFCRLLLTLVQPGLSCVVESLLKCNFAAELHRVIGDVLRFDVPAMLSCLQCIYFICLASSEFRFKFHSSGVTEQLLAFLQAHSNSSDAILTSTHTLLSLCENNPKNLISVMSRGNIFDFSRILRNNAASGKICKSVCAMLVQLSSGGDKAVRSQVASSGMAEELACTLAHKKVHPDTAQAVLLLVIHLVNVVNVLGPEFIAADVPSIASRFCTEEWPARHSDLAKLARDALVHDDAVKYQLQRRRPSPTSGAMTTLIDVLYVNQNVVEFTQTAPLSITEVGILLKEVKSQKDVEFIVEKLECVAVEGDVKLCLKTFKTINIAIDDIASNKVHFMLARSLVEQPHLICGAMAACLQTAEVQTFGFNIIKLLPYYLEDGHEFGEHGECDLVYLTMRRHIDNSSLVESGLECAAVLATARYENKKHFGKLDGLRNIRFVMEAFDSHSVVLTKCLHLVVTVCSGCTEIQDAVRESGFLAHLLAFLRARQADEDVVHCCCEALIRLFAQNNQQNNQLVAGLGSINQLLDVISNNVTSSLSCTAVSRLIMAITSDSSDEAVAVLLESKAAQSLMQVLQRGADNGLITKVAKVVCLLIVYFVCNFPAMREQFLDADFLKFFDDLANAPSTNEQISKSIQVALKKLLKLQAKQSQSSALQYIDVRLKDDGRKRGAAAKKIGRRASLFVAALRQQRVRHEAEERMAAIARDLPELSFFHEFREALELAVEYVKPQLAREVLRRATSALQECGEVSSKSPLGSSFLQHLEVVFAVMSAFLSVPDIQIAAIDIFHCLTFSPEEYQNFGEKGGFDLVLPILRRHISNSNICFGLLQCAALYLQDETGLNRAICGQDKKELKTISKIVSVYLENSDNARLRNEFRPVILLFLHNLCFKSPLVKNWICEVGVTAQLVRHLLQHAGDEGAAAATCAALASLCEDSHQKSLGAIMCHDNILSMVRAIRSNTSSVKTCRAVSALLVGLSGGGEKAVQSELSKSGIATELVGILSDFRRPSRPVPVPAKVECSVIMLVLHLVCNISSMTNEFVAANMAPQLEHYLTPAAAAGADWDVAVRQAADMALRKLRKDAKTVMDTPSMTSKRMSSLY